MSARKNFCKGAKYTPGSLSPLSFPSPTLPFLSLLFLSFLPVPSLSLLSFGTLPSAPCHEEAPSP